MTSAATPFRFHTAAVLARLTHRHARTLKDLLEGLRGASGSLIFQHTYNSLLERHFIPGAPQNDFAFWVTETLRQRALGERLAAVDPYEYTDLAALRQKLVEILEEHFQGGGEDVAAPAGLELHFLESVSVASPTAFVAHDLAGFREALSRVAIRSIYHHFLTARLRLGKIGNDFSVWLSDSLGEKDLAAAFERIDPGVSTLEDVRARMLRLLDQRLSAQRRRNPILIGLLGSSALGGIAAGLHLRRKSRGKNGQPTEGL